MTISITRVSSKGQVVIPKDVKSNLGIREGDRLIVYSLRDMIVLRKARKDEPLLGAVSSIFRQRAQKGMWTRKDVATAIANVRAKEKG